MLNRNIGCIEITKCPKTCVYITKLNRNIGCIEMFLRFVGNRIFES